MPVRKAKMPDSDQLMGMPVRLAQRAVLLFEYLQSRQSGEPFLNSAVQKLWKCGLRTVQSSFAELVRLGLIRRVAVDPCNPFSPVKTEFLDPGRVEQIKAALGPKGMKITAWRKNDKAPPQAVVRKPFSYLRDEARLCEEDFLSATQDAGRFWDWMSEAVGKTGLTVGIEVVVQRRRVKDGVRGGLAPALKYVGSLGGSSLPDPTKFLAYAEKHFMESTFRVVAKNESVSPLIMIDDVSIDKLGHLPKRCAVLETSPDNFQVNMVAPRPLSPLERRCVQAALIRVLNGDPGANASNQLRRLPGSLNNKPGLPERAFYTRIHSLSEAMPLTDRQLRFYLHQGAMIIGVDKDKSMVEPGDQFVFSGVSVVMPKRIDDPSRRDFAVAIRMLREKRLEGEIRGFLIDSAKGRDKYGSSAGMKPYFDYAALTLAKARKAFGQ